MEGNLRSSLNLWVTVYIRNKTQIREFRTVFDDKNLHVRHPGKDISFMTHESVTALSL